MFACTRAGRPDTGQVIPSPSTLFYLEFTNLARLAGQRAPGILMSLPLPRAGIIGAYHQTRLSHGCRSSFTVVWQALHPLSHLPCLRTGHPFSDCSLRPGSLCSCLLSVCPHVFWASPPALLALPASLFVTRSCLVSSQGKWREKGRGLQHTSLKLEANVSSGGEVLLNKHTAVSFISSWQEGRPTREGKPGRMGREQRWMMGPRIRQGGLGAAVRA